MRHRGAQYDTTTRRTGIEIGRVKRIDLGHERIRPAAGFRTAVNSSSNVLASAGNRRQVAEQDRALSDACVDGQAACGIRERTFVAVPIDVGNAIVVLARSECPAAEQAGGDESGCGTRDLPAQPTRPTLNLQVFAHDMRDIHVIPTTGDGHGIDRAACRRGRAHEETVERIADRGVIQSGSNQHVPKNIGTNTIIVGRERNPLMTWCLEVRLFERIGIGRNRRIGAGGDQVVRDRRPSRGQMDRRNDARNRTDQHAATAITDVSMIDVVQEDAFFVVDEISFCTIDVIAHLDTTPVASRWHGGELIVVESDGFIVVGSEEDPLCWRAEYLNGSATAIDTGQIAAYTDPGSAELQDRTRIDHDGHPLRDFHRRTIHEGSALRVETDLVGPIVTHRRQIAVRASISDNPYDVTGASCIRMVWARRILIEGITNVVKWVRERPEWQVQIGCVGLVDIDRTRLARGLRAGRCGRAEPKVVHAAWPSIGIAINQRGSRLLCILGADKPAVDRIHVVDIGDASIGVSAKVDA